MTNFTKEDLQDEYNWSADEGDNPKLKGEPDSLIDKYCAEIYQSNRNFY